MATIELTLTVVSPTFMYGAYQRGSDTQPEMRAQSVRGQLRYWLRAILGAGTTELKQVWDAESAVFGSTGMGSAVSVRVYPRHFEPERVPMMPHKSNPHDRKQSEAKAVPENTRALLQLVTRPGVEMPADALNALKVWSLLGGVGKRSRRMFGAVRVSSKDDAWYVTPATVEEFMELTATTLNAVIGAPPKRASIPDWPTLHPNHSWVVIGREHYDSAEEANERLFRDLLRKGEYLNEDTSFGFAGGGGRRASTLHAQVRRIGSVYYPVLTALRSQPEQKIKWDVLARFMNEAKQHFNGETVWGDW